MRIRLIQNILKTVMFVMLQRKATKMQPHPVPVQPTHSSRITHSQANPPTNPMNSLQLLPPSTNKQTAHRRQPYIGLLVTFLCHQVFLIQWDQRQIHEFVQCF